MTSSEDTEITLGTGKLLFLFFGVVGMCALFFALGYSLGRKSEPTILAASAASPQVAPNTNKASGTSTAGSAPPPMTFYKSVEQKDANPQLTPVTDPRVDTAAVPANSTPSPTPPANTADSPTTLPTAGYFVQVAAVTKQEDAGALVDALKKKDYPAFVAPQSTDKFFRVQVGPFSDIKDAEAMRTRLVGDGYSPIVKK